MTTSLPLHSALPLDEATYKQAQNCVHCGLCLPACPTYLENRLEVDAPRGRIHLMKAMAEGRIEATDSVRKHLDLCLDCRACETACPSGVVYHELIETARSILPPAGRRTFSNRVIDFMCFHVMPYPTRMKLAMLPARLVQKLGLWKLVSKLNARTLSPSLAKMQQMLPESGPLWPSTASGTFGPTANRPAAKAFKVGFHSGCVGSVMQPGLHQKTIELLQHLGCEVVVAPSQACCGAIHHHGGRPADAAEFAKRNIEAFADCDFVVSNIAGCGAMLKEYNHLLHGDAAWAEKAKAFSAKTRDVSEVIVALNPPKPPHRVERCVTYHDACHLAHGQKVTAPPRKLLAMIEGLTVVPLTESDTCCGAAGTYNLLQPEMARRLAERKIRNIEATGCKICVTGNIGCSMQIRSESARTGANLELFHPVELLHEAYFGRR
jgi:glycolate oxidase iron-sulfur subunit